MEIKGKRIGFGRKGRKLFSLVGREYEYKRKKIVEFLGKDLNN